MSVQRWRHYAIIRPLRVMEEISQWNISGIRANIEELQLLCTQYRLQIVAVQECKQSENK